jgi:2-C-methyl-D-erythritol 4-phosphate cytidylyltransferase/2-C-methyl-D-erythritol 2,4-cyclodiphosphate synthase
LSDLTLILLAAGNSSRFGHPVKKQWLRIEHDPLWHFVTKRLNDTGFFTDIIITGHPDEVTYMHSYTDFTVVAGGKTRQKSLSNALEHVTSDYVLVNDIARACVDPLLIQNIIMNKNKADCIVPFLPVNDTIVYGDTTINRDEVRRIQTPQLSRTDSLRKALRTNVEYSDESSAIKASGGSRFYLEGHEDAHKLTYLYDLNRLPCLQVPASTTLIGTGLDVHAFEDNTQMVLGGVRINAEFGFKAHSDGDVAIHALIDALLGAAGLGDIGILFPDTDNAYENIDSKILLQKTVLTLHQLGYIVVNADITIAAQAPRLAEYKDAMRKVLSSLLKIPASRMNIKATTTEKLGFVGRKEGVAVMASASLEYFDWTKA